MTAWMNKFFSSLFASIAVISILAFPLELLPVTILERLSMLPFLPLLLQGAPSVFAMVFSLICQKNDRPNGIDSGRRFGLLLGILRYWLAFLVSVYGFAKILGAQFGKSYIRDDRLSGELSGFELTWGYF